MAKISVLSGVGRTGAGGSSPPPTQPSAVSVSELGPRTLAPLGRPVTILRAVFTGAGSDADRAEMRLYLGGNELYGQFVDWQVFPITRSGGSVYVDFAVYVPTDDESWVLKVALGNAYATQPWSTAKASAAFNISAIGPAANNDVTNAQIGPIRNTVLADGTQEWTVSISATISNADPNFWTSKIVRVEGHYDAGGNFVPAPWAPADPRTQDPGIQQFDTTGDISFDFGPWSYPSATGENVIRFMWFARSRQGGDANQDAWVLQASAFGGDHFDLVLTPPDGASFHPPDQAVSIALTEVGARTCSPDLPGGPVATLRATLTLTGSGPTPDRAEVRLYDQFDDDRFGILGGQVFPVVFPAGGGSPYIDVPVYSPPEPELWHLKVSLATANAANPWSTAIASQSYTIAGIALPGSNEVRSLIITPGGGGNFPYNTSTPDGMQYWLIPAISYDDTGCTSDPSAWFVRVTVQCVDLNHQPIGPEQPYAGTQVFGGIFNCGNLMGPYGTQGFGYTATTNVAYVRFRVYVISRVDQTTASFTNPQAAALQTGIGGGAGYVDVLVAANGALPPGTVDLTRSSLSSLGSGLTKDGSGKPTVNYGPGTQDDGSGKVTVKYATPLTILNNQITLATSGVTNAYIAANAVLATNLVDSAVTESKIAASAVSDVKVANVNVSKLISGTCIFTGDAIFTRGYSQPIIALNSSGLYLYSMDQTGGGQGYTSGPYAAIQSSGLGFFSGGGGNSSVIVNSSGVTLYYTNGSTSTPYVAITSGGVKIANSSFTNELNATGIKLSYGTGVVSSLTSAAIIFQNGTYVANLGASFIQLWSYATVSGSTVTGNSSYPCLGITTSSLLITAGGYVGTFQSDKIKLDSGAGQYVEITAANGVKIVNGSYSLVATASSLVLSGGGGSVTITSTDLTVQYDSSNKLNIASGTATFTLNGLSTSINGNSLATGTILCAGLTITPGMLAYNGVGTIQSAAGAGSASLPSNPAGFLFISVNGTTYKFPIYPS